MVTTVVDHGRLDHGNEDLTTGEKVSARLWLYPPRRRMGIVPSQAILAAARTGVDIEVGDVSIGIAGECHNVFAAIEQIFTGVGAHADIALIATIQCADE
jgi:hypothetical protein